MSSINCLIVGAQGVGKRTFVSRFVEGVFNKYQIAKGFTASPVPITTNFGRLTVNLIVADDETNINPNFVSIGLRIHCCILMFDVMNRQSYRGVPEIFRSVQGQIDQQQAGDDVTLASGVPICLVGNKVDSSERHVKPKFITFHRKKNLQYYDISAKSNYNAEKPLLWLVKKMTGNIDLCLVDSIALHLPEVVLHTGRTGQYEREMQQANDQALPESDDDF